VRRVIVHSAPNSASKSRTTSCGDLMVTQLTSRSVGLRDSFKRLDLGCHDSMKQAKRVYELHCATGCDLSEAKKITH